ncbi:unnamed protein product [Durusdinium trenchii]|uniref:Uncharacterized protein n=2 Tax=Durusdinium trenchii TaxID=1381693 RepID=A0ABP0MYV2_9DINO
MLPTSRHASMWISEKRLRTKTSEPLRADILSTVANEIYFEAFASQLSVVDLTRLATVNGRYRALPWPRLEALWGPHCKLQDLSQEKLAPALECLGERLRATAHVRKAVVAVRCGERDRLDAWAAEEVHRAAWSIVALMSTPHWNQLDERGYLMRFLVSGLREAAMVAPLATAFVISNLIESDSDLEVLGQVKVTASQVLSDLVHNALPTVQKVALEAIHTACDWHCDPLEIGNSTAVPAIISVTESGCHENRLAAVNAIYWLSESCPERLKIAIPLLVDFLGHCDFDMKNAAASALWFLLLNHERPAEYAQTACEHGCIPLLISELHDQEKSNSIELQTCLFCLESLMKVPTIRPIALQHGLLPELLRCLVNEEDRILLECTLGLLQTCQAQLPKALLAQNRPWQRAILQKLLLVALKGVDSSHSTDRGNSTVARQLLEHVDLVEVSLRPLLQEVGYTNSN